MAATRRPDLSKKTDPEVFDLFGFHLAEALKRLTAAGLQPGGLTSVPASVSLEVDLDGDTEEDIEPTTTVKKPKSTKAKKPEPEGDTEEDDFDPFADPEEEEPEITSEDVRLALKDYAVLHDRDAALEIMKKVGKADSVAKIDPKLYPSVMKAVEIAKPAK